MSVIIIGTGGHKAIALLKEAWPKMSPAQQQDALQLEAKFLADAQILSEEACHDD